MKTGYVYHPIYLKHDTGQHVENAKRLEAAISYLEYTGLIKQLTPINPRPATIEELAWIHQEQHISHIKEMANKGGGWLDADTVISPDSYETALYAAGGTIEAVETVLNGGLTSAFALVRPPGHHATAQKAMGFCLFNNVAIATKYALARGLERILIIDFDVHHGNGTQNSFYDNSQALYISAHQSPFFPGTGEIGEIGVGKGKGYTINIPLPSGCCDTEYEQIFAEIIVPASRRFQPQFILVSAGYDLHWSDSMALIQVSVSGFAWMTGIIKNLADELCNSRLVFVLEGGYNLNAQAASIKATFDILLGNQFEDPLGQPPHRFSTPDLSHLIKTIRELHSLT